MIGSLLDRLVPPKEAGELDEVDRAALRDLHERYGAVELGPLVAVIAAYEEEGGIGRVLEDMPSEVHGRRLHTIVVDDGSRDGTAAEARAAGAIVCRAGRNRGQGAALRLGYHIAREAGAEIIVTLDADGQYLPSEIADVVAPILEGQADFVTGSRVLGREETTDDFRRAGVRFFAWLASRLAEQRLTDTSNGLRAMRAEVTGTVTLTQPQYQASELLLGAIAKGYRVVEVPTTMRDRTAGASKKGNDILYGMRYARVMVGTWWRERS